MIFWSNRHFYSQHLNSSVNIRSGPGKPNQRKASSWTFRRGIPEQKFNANRACFPKGKHQNSQKWAKFMNFLFWPFLRFGLPGRLLKIINQNCNSTQTPSKSSNLNDYLQCLVKYFRMTRFGINESKLQFRAQLPNSHRVIQGVPPRGRQLLSTFQVLKTLYSQRQKHPFLP